MKKILVWETHSMISGGQKMTLLISELLGAENEFVYMIPGEGALSKELDRRKIQYHMLGDQSMPAGVKGKSVIFRYAGLSLNAIAKALRIIAKEKPDLIYAPGPAALPWSAICGTLSNKPVIWHLHHVFLDNPTKKLLNLFSNWRSVKKIIAVSNCVGSQIITSAGKRKVTVLYNPVDTEQYSNGSAVSIRKEYPNLEVASTENTITLGHIALMQETKRQNIVIEAAFLLQCKGYHCNVVFAGGTKNSEDEQYLLSLKKKVAEYHMENNIFFLGFRSDIPNVLACCNLVMIPSAFEGFPLAGLEANAAGLPVICANQGGSLEYAKVSTGGEIFRFDDAEDAASAVIRCLEKYDYYACNAKNFAKKCSVANYKDNIYAILIGNKAHERNII